MQKYRWKPYAFWIAATEAIGAFSGLLTRKGTELYSYSINKPPLSPPSVVFPIVWGILFLLMGAAAARVYIAPDSKDRKIGLLLYLVQLFFNFMWSILFFNMQAFGFSFFWLLALWVLVILTAARFKKVDKVAYWFMIPYVVWITFAAYLNFGVWKLN